MLEAAGKVAVIHLAEIGKSDITFRLLKPMRILKLVVGYEPDLLR